MISNPYIFIADLNLDLDKIRKIVLQDLYKPVVGLASHQRFIDNHPYLVDIKKCYPFLSNLYNIYETPPNYTTPVHIDTERNCALNIPILNTENSFTVFYNAPFEQSTNVQDRVYNTVVPTVEESFRFTLSVPTFINTKIPHGVLQCGSNTRIVMSWSILGNYTYEQINACMLG